MNIGKPEKIVIHEAGGEISDAFVPGSVSKVSGLSGKELHFVKYKSPHKEFINIKNGEKYTVLDWKVIDANNGHEEAEAQILYINSQGEKFIRSVSEFQKKFRKNEPQR
jgi:hypothetical protein